jgi:hypothetical protein
MNRMITENLLLRSQPGEGNLKKQIEEQEPKKM